MRGKPRGQYGPTGERNSGIRYVPPKEQKEMDEQWRTIYERQQARIAALEAEIIALSQTAVEYLDTYSRVVMEAQAVRRKIMSERDAAIAERDQLIVELANARALMDKHRETVIALVKRARKGSAV